MIVNRTVLSKADLEFAAKHRRKEPRIAVLICFVALCGAALLIIGGLTLYKAVSPRGNGGIVIAAGALAMGVLFICWSISYNKLWVMRSI